MLRGTFRPFRMHPVLRGLRLTGFYDRDAYLQARRAPPRDRSPRRSSIRMSTPPSTTWRPRDQTSVAAQPADGRGCSLWATPRTPTHRLGRTDPLRPLRAGPGARRPPEPVDRRRRLLVPAPGHGVHGAPARRRERRQLQDLRAGSAVRITASRCMRSSTSEIVPAREELKRRCIRQAKLLTVRRRRRRRHHGVGPARSRSTAPAPPSRTRSTRSGSPSTTSCIPTSRINYQSIGSGGGIRQVSKPHGVLRRHRRPDDQRAAAGGRRARSSTSPPSSAPSCRSTTCRASAPS